VLIETCLGKLAVEECGRGPAVVLWHSLFFDRTIWSALASALSRTQRVVLIDGPGHGESASAGRSFTMEECGRAALQVMDALSIDRAAVGGISWGGMVALRAALLAPARIRSLLLLDTTADAAGALERVRATALAAAVERVGFPAILSGPLFALTYAKAARLRSPSLRADLQARLQRLDRRAAGAATRAVLRDRTGVLPALGALRMPALVVAGTVDWTFPLAHAERLAASLPQARLERLEGVGHLSILEEPDRVIELVSGALKMWGHHTD
jgi:3-oxoadipate enol-lactonase